MHHYKYPPEQLSLLAEIRRHPELAEQLNIKKNPNGPTDIAEWYGVVAAYVGIVLDGFYYPEDFLNLARMLTDALYAKRSSLVVASTQRKENGS